MKAPPEVVEMVKLVLRFYEAAYPMPACIRRRVEVVKEWLKQQEEE